MWNYGVIGLGFAMCGLGWLLLIVCGGASEGRYAVAEGVAGVGAFIVGFWLIHYGLAFVDPLTR